MLRSTANQTLDRIDEEEVVFLSTQDPKLIHRYSVLVRLLVEQPDTYNYFNTLKELSVQSANFFSAVQPGYLTGNLFNPINEMKVGASFGFLQPMKLESLSTLPIIIPMQKTPLF